jgi:hypothetical protein
MALRGLTWIFALNFFALTVQGIIEIKPIIIAAHYKPAAQIPNIHVHGITAIYQFTELTMCRDVT